MNHHDKTKNDVTVVVISVIYCRSNVCLWMCSVCIKAQWPLIWIHIPTHNREPRFVVDHGRSCAVQFDLHVTLDQFRFCFFILGFFYGIYSIILIKCGFGKWYEYIYSQMQAAGQLMVIMINVLTKWVAFGWPSSEYYKNCLTKSVSHFVCQIVNNTKTICISSHFIYVKFKYISNLNSNQKNLRRQRLISADIKSSGGAPHSCKNIIDMYQLFEIKSICRKIMYMISALSCCGYIVSCTYNRGLHLSMAFWVSFHRLTDMLIPIKKLRRSVSGHNGNLYTNKTVSFQRIGPGLCHHHGHNRMAAPLPGK